MNTITHFYLNSWMTLNICEVRGNVFLNSCEHHKVIAYIYILDLQVKVKDQVFLSVGNVTQEECHLIFSNLYNTSSRGLRDCTSSHQYIFFEKGVYNHFTGSSSICCDLSLDNALL